MFEAIQHSFNDDSMTVARYVSGDVHGSVCFTSDNTATRVRSSIGPVGATRECLASHWAGYRGRYKARIEDEVQCYA